MLIKLNNKPIKVTDDPAREQHFSPVYCTVSTIGFTLILWLLDYVSYTFFYTHPLPWIAYLGKLIGGLL